MTNNVSVPTVLNIGEHVKKIAILFFLGWAVVYADRTVLYPLLPIIGEEYNLTNTQIGLIASAYFLPYVVMQIPAGLLGDRWGYKRILVVFFFLAGVGLLALGLVSTGYLPLLFWVGLHGLGAGAFFATAYGFTMAEAPSEARGLLAAIINSGMGLGLAVGLAMAGPVFVLTENWKLPFIILALPTIAMAALYAFSLKKGPSHGTRSNRANFRNLNIGILPLYVAFFCSIYAFWVVVTWGPSYLYNERGLELEAAGSLVAIVAVVAIPAAIIAGRVSDRIGRKPLSLILLLLAALSVVGIAMAKVWWSLLATLVFYGLVGKLTWDPIAISWAGDRSSLRNPEGMGATMGLLNFSGMLSAVLAPTVSGWITDITGSLDSAFYVAALLLLVGAVVIALLEETIKRSNNYQAKYKRKCQIE